MIDPKQHLKITQDKTLSRCIYEILSLNNEITSEDQFVDWVETMITQEENLLGHREDAIAVEFGKSIMVINIDGWVESTDRPPGMTPEQVGFRAVANAISDVIVKGARPLGMIISSTIAEKHNQEIKQIIKGFNEASRIFGVPFFGGDMNSGRDLVIDVTVWGIAEELVKRNGAKPGDEVFWLGPSLGCTAAALGILTQNWSGPKEMALHTMGRPALYPEFLSLKANAATDSSDGLAKSLYHIGRASQVRVNLDLNNIDTDDWIKEVAESQDLDLLDLILFGGEELGVVFTISKADTDQLENVDNCVRIGSISEGDGVFINGKPVPNKGWDHFNKE